MAQTATKKRFFTKEQLSQIKPGAAPKHIAIIPDGNRRWAARHSLSTAEGHQKGCDAVLDIVESAKELGVTTITFYTFSTENWHRPAEEIDTLMYLLINYLKEQTPRMVAEGIRLHTIGDTSKLRNDVQEALIEAKAATLDGKESNFVMAINYGGRDEICRTTQRILEDFQSGKLSDSNISEETFSKYLDTSPWGDPELLFRTSGEQRISNFLLWQLSYAELYMTQTLWPDVTPQDLLNSVLWYQARNKRIGK